MNGVCENNENVAKWRRNKRKAISRKASAAAMALISEKSRREKRRTAKWRSEIISEGIWRGINGRKSISKAKAAHRRRSNGERLAEMTAKTPSHVMRNSTRWHESVSES
jgi:hypothetical protein